MGKGQKIHNLGQIIAKPYIALLSLLGLLIGYNIGFFLLSLTVLCPIAVLLLISFRLHKREKSVLTAFLLALIIGIGLGVPKTKARTDYGSYQGIVIENRQNYFIFDSGFHRYYVYEKNSEREEGDYLEIIGRASKLSFTSYEGYFSFKDYLNKKGVDSELSPTSIEVKFERPFRLAKYENEFIERFDDPATKGLLSSLLFNNKDYKNETILLVSSINALNFLSTSGLLLAGILRFLDWLFYLKFEKEKSATIVTILSFFLLPFGIRKIGYWRIILYRLISLYCMIKHKEINSLTRVSLVAIFLFLVNPYNALNSGYLIGFGLSIFMMLTEGWRKKYERNDRKAVDYLYLMHFLFPIFIKGNAIHPLSPIYSFVLMPLILPFGILGYLSFASLPFVTVFKLYSSFLVTVLKAMSFIDMPLPVGGFNDLSTFVYYFLLSLYFVLMDVGWSKHADYLALFSVVALLLNATPVLNFGLDQIVFVNVGQGDCIFIRNNSKTVMIDTGGNTSFDIATEVLIPFLRKERVTSLDYLIITHEDADHAGGVDSLIANFTVRHVLREDASFPLTFGDMAFQSLNKGGSGNENDDSLVLSLNFMGKDWIFTGDASTKVEKEIIKSYPDLKCDILKIGHHGSDTSTSEEFLDFLKPETAIISVGENNKFKHPHDSVIRKLSLRNIKIRRTDIEGSIYYNSYYAFLKNYT